MRRNRRVADRAGTTGALVGIALAVQRDGRTWN
jgi:hypothetical protein